MLPFCCIGWLHWVAVSCRCNLLAAVLEKKKEIKKKKNSIITIITKYPCHQLPPVNIKFWTIILAKNNEDIISFESKNASVY